MWEIGDIVYRVEHGIISIYKITKIFNSGYLPYILAYMENCLNGETTACYLHENKQWPAIYSNVIFTSDIDYVKQLIK